MDPISLQVVEETWQKFSDLDPMLASDYVQLLSKEQPIVLAYLMTAGDDFLNQDERELLLYLGIVVWQIMKKGAVPVKRVSEKAIDDHEEKNMKMLEYLEGESDQELIDTVELIIENYNQVEVLKYVVEALMEGIDDEEDDVRYENIGMMMIFLKTVIDCMDI